VNPVVVVETHIIRNEPTHRLFIQRDDNREALGSLVFVLLDHLSDIAQQGRRSVAKSFGRYG